MRLQYRAEAGGGEVGIAELQDPGCKLELSACLRRVSEFNQCQQQSARHRAVNADPRRDLGEGHALVARTECFDDSEAPRKRGHEGLADFAVH